MFTGLISDIGTIEHVSPGTTLKRVRIRCAYLPGSVALGASVACGGPCLTVVAVEPSGHGCAFDVDIGAETLARTNAGSWKHDTKINLERSLRVGDELGGHIVTGHIDGLAEILEVASHDGMIRYALRAPERLLHFLAEKGSVALDGTSLTVNGVDADIFSVLLVPHTLAVTTWGERRVGDAVNLEVDLMARYAARLTEARPART